jgi:hypothetical protein
VADTVRVGLDRFVLDALGSEALSGPSSWIGSRYTLT